MAAALIRERQAGIVSSDPAEMAGQLSRWLEAQESVADIPDLPGDASKAKGKVKEHHGHNLVLMQESR